MYPFPYGALACSACCSHLFIAAGQNPLFHNPASTLRHASFMQPAAARQLFVYHFYCDNHSAMLSTATLSIPRIFFGTAENWFRTTAALELSNRAITHACIAKSKVLSVAFCKMQFYLQIILRIARNKPLSAALQLLPAREPSENSRTNPFVFLLAKLYWHH